jgi:hypothetical protein
MGNSSTIGIHLDETNLFYFAGETITGTVELNVTEGKVEADEIYIELTGEIGYTTTRTVYNNNNYSTTNGQFGQFNNNTTNGQFGQFNNNITNGQFGQFNNNTTTQTDYHNVPFYSTKAVFAQPKAGQKQVVYTKGRYSWPFEIPITHHLPPTIHDPQTYPRVRYYLQVVIDKPWYKPNTRETIYLTIFPRFNLLQNPQCLQSAIFGNHNRKDITLSGTLDKTGYVPGESIHITLKIENPNRVFIKRIDLSMLQSYRIGENSRDNNIFETALPNIMNTKDEHIKQACSIQIPSTILPPSYLFNGGIEKAAFVVTQYMLKFVVRVEGFFTNFDIDMPVTIGTESYPEQPVITNDVLPPIYESVVHHKK